MNYSDWNIPPEQPEIPRRLTEAGYTPLLAALLARRGLDTPEAAESFLRGGPELLGDPLLLEDMDRAAARLRLAIERRETVAVFGDYDVDGITSACLVTSFLRAKGLDCEPYIPDRMEEGYGLNLAAMDTIKARGASLIVTVDCGITAAQEAGYAASLGMDMVITDHHECGACPLPAAVAVVDPTAVTPTPTSRALAWPSSCCAPSRAGPSACSRSTPTSSPPARSPTSCPSRVKTATSSAGASPCWRSRPGPASAPCWRSPARWAGG